MSHIPTIITVLQGGTGAETAAGARTNLGLAIGTDVQAQDATLQSIAALGTAADRAAYTTGVDTWAETPLTAAGRAIIDDATAGDQRTTLGLGTIATQNSNSVTITGGSISGITDLAVADGGTGASTAADARINLGVNSAPAIATAVGFAVVTNVVQYPTGPITISSVTVTVWTVYAPTGSTWKIRLSVDGAVPAAETLTMQCLYSATLNGAYANEGAAITRVAADGTAVAESALLSPAAGYLRVSIVHSAATLGAQCHMELLRIS